MSFMSWLSFAQRYFYSSIQNDRVVSFWNIAIFMEKKKRSEKLPTSWDLKFLLGSGTTHIFSHFFGKTQRILNLMTRQQGSTILNSRSGGKDLWAVMQSATLISHLHSFYSLFHLSICHNPFYSPGCGAEIRVSRRSSSGVWWIDPWFLVPRAVMSDR